MTSGGGNALSTYRNDELVNIAEFGSGGTDHAIRGVTGQKVNFTVDVDHAGEYIVQFFMSNTAAGGNIRLQTPGGDTYFSDGIDNQSVPNTGSFSTYSNDLKRLVKFDAPGPHTVQLYFRTSASNGVSAQVDSLTFSPVNLSLVMGPFPNLTPAGTINKGSITNVGTVFAINTPGYIDKLKFYVSSEELAASAPPAPGQPGKIHTVNLWKVGTTTVAFATGGQVTMTYENDTIFATADVPFGELLPGWNEATPTWYPGPPGPIPAPMEQPLLQPGLYVVSVDVFAETIATSTIAQVAPNVSPSVLTLVAGSYGTANQLGNPAFAPFVYSDNAGFPTAYFWLDVSFTPMY